MNNTLSRDSLAIILICSSLGMDIKNETIKPYTIKQWNELSNKLLNSEMKRPAAFFETDEQEWKNYLLMNDDDAMKLKKLLSRAGQVGIELEYLNSTGIYVTTRAEKNYPNRLKKILKKNSPPVIFYCGNIDITQSDGVAVVGSRKIDEKALEFTKTLVTKCTAQGFTIVSGGARGVDTAAQNAALLSGGKVISVVADSLLQRIKRKDVREAIMSGNLLLVTPSNPKNGFTVYSAMDRNKYIYALSKYAVVVSSDNNKGGTWTGAVENLKNKWVPLFVRKDDWIPEGNIGLIDSGALPLSTSQLNENSFNIKKFFELEKEKIIEKSYVPEQYSIFSYVREQPEEMNHKAVDTCTPTTKDEIDKDLEKIDLFPIIWPFMKKVLKEARSKEQLSELLNINKAQLSIWLDRAISENKVKKITRPVRYVLFKE